MPEPPREYRFKPGQSGNPSGRSRESAYLAALARTRTKEAIDTLVKVMRDSRSPSARIRAACEILDRGWGRPPQARQVSDEQPTPGERSEAAERARKILEDAVAAVLAGDDTVSLPQLSHDPRKVQ